MPFACIYVPDFPVEAVLRAEPDLRVRAVAVLAGKPPLQKVFGVNEKARRLGIEPGMTKAQVEVCTELALRSRSPLQETTAHAALLDCAQSFSPRVEDTACDTVLLDLAGLETLFGPLPKIAHNLARRACDFGLEVNVAVAANPDTATLAARGFSGVTVILPGQEAEQLGSLPLAVLFGGLSDFHCDQEAERLLATLGRWGVRNLRALAALPEVALSERLGQEGVRLQQLARGAASRTLVPVEPLLAFEEVIELEYPLVLLEPLAFLLHCMLEQLCARLAARALATQELRLELELGNAAESQVVPSKDCPRCSGEQPESRDLQSSRDCRKKFQRTLRLPVPMLDAKVFLRLLQLDLKAHPPGAPIVKVHLAAEPVRPRASQGGLFLPPTPEPEKLELTLARIAGIVGEDKVGSLELLDTHRPEGFRMQRFAPEVPQGPKPSSKEDASSAGLKPCATKEQGMGSGNGAVTALRFFRPPLRATVTLRDGKPARLACRKRKEVQGAVLWAAGPWRSSGDWWKQEGWARDEWDIALQSGTSIVLYRLVHDLLSGDWFVEGTYD